MKISGSYASLLRGVSQQPTELRQPGQHTEQVNMLSDPVKGLVRRAGSLLQSLQGLTPGSIDAVTAMMAEWPGYRKLEHASGGKEYVVLIKDTGRVGYISGDYTGYLPATVVYNITDRVFIPQSTDVATLAADGLVGVNGVSAAVSVGRIAALAVKNIGVTASTQQLWGDNAYTANVVWVRGGAYNRTYSVTLANGWVGTFTTPDAAAVGAAAAIAPANIATQLGVSLTAAGATCSVIGSYILVNGRHESTVTDGGDNSLIRAVTRVIDDASKLPILAVNGQIVKIQTGSGEFYVQAQAKTVSAALNEVGWVESAGLRQGVAINNLLVFTVEAGTWRMALSPAALLTATPVSFVSSTAGDATSNPAPFFLRGTPITYMGMLQDRLLIGAGAALAVSAAGDYFNFMRSTVVSVRASDGFEMIAQGGEDDLLRSSVTYSKNLVIFGDKRQYLVSGQQALTPTSANMSIMTTYADAATVPPLSAGGQIYYARNKAGFVGVHQIQPGNYVDSAESYPASAQVGEYIPAPARHLEAVAGVPSTLLVSTKAEPRKLYVFNYIDAPDGRKQEAWGRWEFSPYNGNLLGMHNTKDGLLLFWVRSNAQFPSLLSFVVDVLDTTAALPQAPYVDSAIINNSGWDQFDRGGHDPTLITALGRSAGDRYLLGGSSDQEASLPAGDKWQGFPFDSYVELTRPVRLDSKGVVITDGRLVITALSVTTKFTAGLVSSVAYGGASVVQEYTARVVGSPANLIGVVPVADGVYSVPTGREAREHSVTLKSLGWYPLSITTVRWVGQSFNRTPSA